MKIVKVLLSVVVVSFYYFPFEFKFLPGVNTKMFLALIGLIVLGCDIAKRRSACLDRDFLVISLIAASISLLSVVSSTYNHTLDLSFVGFLMSAWVWLGGAYFVVRWMERVLGSRSIIKLCDYIIAVSVVQCLIAYAIDINVPLRIFVNGFMGGDEAAYGIAEGRIYGIGAALDVAGLKFSAVLVICSYFSMNRANLTTKGLVLYLLSFFVIVVIGNMISRTTIVGMVISLMFWIISSIFPYSSPNNARAFWRTFAVMLICILPIITVLYNVNDTFRENLRFGFEGFFSLVESGKWEVSSNDILFNHMIVFPDSVKTWIIGDGYAMNPYGDPFYVGQSYHGYYKGTDIGYLRFLFYFGFVGVSMFLAFIVKACAVCIKCYPLYKFMFIMLLLVNLIGWFKVTTDIFLMFALFICMSKISCDTE